MATKPEVYVAAANGILSELKNYVASGVTKQERLKETADMEGTYAWPKFSQALGEGIKVNIGFAGKDVSALGITSKELEALVEKGSAVDSVQHMFSDDKAKKLYKEEDRLSNPYKLEMIQAEIVKHGLSYKVISPEFAKLSDEEAKAKFEEYAVGKGQAALKTLREYKAEIDSGKLDFSKKDPRKKDEVTAAYEAFRYLDDIEDSLKLAGKDEAALDPSKSKDEILRELQDIRSASDEESKKADRQKGASTILNDLLLAGVTPADKEVTRPNLQSTATKALTV